MQKQFDNNNFNIDMEMAEKHAFRVRLREVFTDGLLTLAKWNFLFVLCCLPVVTIAPAVAALLNCTNLQVTDDRPQFKAAKWYWLSFKAACRKLFVPGLIFTAANFVFVFGFAFYLKMTSQSIMYVPMASLSLIVLVLLWAVAIHAFPMMYETVDFDNATVTMTEKSVAEIFKKAIPLVFEKAKGTVMAVAIGFVVIAMQMLFLPASIPVVLVIGFAIPAQAAALAHTKPEIMD